MIRTAGLLKACGFEPETYHAGVDFLSGWILDPEALETASESLARGASEPEERELLRRAERYPGGWAGAIAGALGFVETLSSPSFYDPSRCAEALGGLHDLLALASWRLRPLEIRWEGVFHPGIGKWTETERFAGAPAAWPFERFYRERVAPRLACSRPQRVLICIENPGEVLSGLALASYCRSTAPEMPVALLWDGPLHPGSASAPARFGPGDEQALLAWIGKQAVPAPGASPAAPACPPMPETNWAPERVITVGTFWTCGGGRGPGEWPQPEDLSGKDVKGLLFNVPLLAFRQWLARLAPYAAQDRGLRFAVTSALEAGCAVSEDFERAYALGIRLIQWRVPETTSDRVERVLAASARAGLWNHLWFAPGHAGNGRLVRFMQSNPNIVHGWRICPAAAPPWLAVRDLTDFGRYGEAERLPGGPLWYLCQDPAYILLYLARHGTARLRRWWVEGGGVETLGSDLRYHFESPQRLPPGYLEEIVRMVEAGGAVNRQWVRYNLERAFLIGYVIERGRIVANSSLKRPRREYVDKVSRQAGIDLSGYLERGYTSVRPEYRGLGIGTRLLEGLTARAGGRKIYSVISADNVATQKIAIRNRTRQVAAFYSQRLGKQIGVWIPEWMLDP